MRILHKTIKKKWLDMIVSGEKKEEYLEIKPYWISRLINSDRYPKEYPTDGKNIPEDICFDLIENNANDLNELVKGYFSDLKDFDVVKARNGYSPTSPVVAWKHEGVTIGYGKSEWGAKEGVKYLILNIGEILQ